MVETPCSTRTSHYGSSSFGVELMYIGINSTPNDEEPKKETADLIIPISPSSVEINHIIK